MAEHTLITGYVNKLRSAVTWRQDLDDVIAELEDHLYSAVERLEARGTDALSAQRATLERFGDTNDVIAAFASNSRGGIAVPTKSTQSAGTAAAYAKFAAECDSELRRCSGRFGPPGTAGSTARVLRTIPPG